MAIGDEIGIWSWPRAGIMAVRLAAECAAAQKRHHAAEAK